MIAWDLDGIFLICIVIDFGLVEAEDVRLHLLQIGGQLLFVQH